MKKSLFWGFQTLASLSRPCGSESRQPSIFVPFPFYMRPLLFLTALLFVGGCLCQVRSELSNSSSSSGTPRSSQEATLFIAINLLPLRWWDIEPYYAVCGTLHLESVVLTAFTRSCFGFFRQSQRVDAVTPSLLGGWRCILEDYVLTFRFIFRLFFVTQEGRSTETVCWSRILICRLTECLSSALDAFALSLYQNLSVSGYAASMIKLTLC